MTYIIAIAVGFTIIISIAQNARLEQEVNVKQVTQLNFITGLIGAIILFVIMGDSLLVFEQLSKVSLLGFIGGVLGVTVVTIGTIVVRKISIIAAAMLMYTGQLLAGIYIDYLRGIDLSPGKLIGCGLIIAGVYFNSYVDSKKKTSRILMSI